MSLQAVAQPPPDDLRAFARALDTIKNDARRDAGERDLQQLERIERWGRLCTAAGYSTGWLFPNPLSMVLLSQGRLTRWAMVGHHVSHRGYDKVPGVPEHRTSARFAQGKRRFIDWLDWIDPEAWALEHNKLHHYRLGEVADPDLVEENLDWLRDSDMPRALKLAIVAFFAMTWKWSYYAPNTLKALEQDQAQRAGAPESDEPRSLWSMWKRPSLWTRCLLPYAGIQFGIVPALFAPLGPWAMFSTLVNSLGAEALTNLHAFLVITTNHAGEDLYAFDTPVQRGKGEFYYRQVVGSVNFKTGGDFNDFLHGFLNYQIEHHLFPDLSMLQYQEMQPAVRRTCEEFGVPYVQESVFARLRKTVAIMIGDASMRRG